jgi:ATP/maltotriose-dependent transcriptional regulator MalT
LLLEFLAQEIAESRLLILGTYRNVGLPLSHPLLQTLGELARHSEFQNVSLEGLKSEEVSKLILTIAGIRPSPALMEIVRRRTEGNPLYVKEVARLLIEEGSLSGGAEHEDTNWIAKVPEGVRMVINRRLRGLSEQSGQMLVLASVIGREFNLVLLGKLVGELSHDQLLRALEEAASAGMIEEIPDSEGYCRFTHSLVQDTLAGRISRSRKAHLHGRIANALEQLYVGELDAHAGELAHHLALAGLEADEAKLMKYSVIAGRRAMAAHAYEEALTYFRQGLDATSGEKINEEVASLWWEFGTAAVGLVKGEEAWDALSRALTFYIGAGKVHEAVQVLQILPHWMKPLEASTLTSRVVGMMPPDSPDIGRVFSRYGVFQAQTGDIEAAKISFDKALEIARREQDTFLEMWTHERASFAHRCHLNWQGSLGSGLSAIALAPKASNRAAEIAAHMAISLASVWAGDLGTAQIHAAAGLSVAVDANMPRRLLYSLWTSSLVARLKGDFDSSRGLTLKGLQIRPYPNLFCELAMIHFEGGDVEQALTNLEQGQDLTGGISSEMTGSRWPMCLPFAIVGHYGDSNIDLRGAKAWADTIMDDPNTTPSSKLMARATLGLVAASVGDVQNAAEQIDVLEPYKDGMLWVISIRRLLGLLHRAVGDLDRSVENLEIATCRCREAGYMVESAWCAEEWAETLLQRNRKEDRVRARALSQEARDTAESLGMTLLLGRLAALDEAARHGVQARTYPHGLTEREVQVLRLIAAGKTNREIAEELLVSPTTAATHVRNILNKAGLANRAEAAAYTIRHGLLKDQQTAPRQES